MSAYLAAEKPGAITTEHPEFKKVEEEVSSRMHRMLAVDGKRSVTSFHRELGLLVWDKCGMARDRAGLEEAIRPGVC